MIVEKVYGGISLQYGYSGDESQSLMSRLSVLLKTGIFQSMEAPLPSRFMKSAAQVSTKLLFTRYSSFIRETYIKPSKSIELGT